MQVQAKIIKDNDPEDQIVREATQTVRQLLRSQRKFINLALFPLLTLSVSDTLLEKLEADLGDFRKAFNERLMYAPR